MSELKQIQPVFTSWAATEPELGPLLKSIAKAIENSANAHQALLEPTSNDEREYVAYIEAVKDALDRRAALQNDYTSLINELEARRTERKKVI